MAGWTYYGRTLRPGSVSKNYSFEGDDAQSNGTIGERRNERNAACGCIAPLIVLMARYAFSWVDHHCVALFFFDYSDDTDLL